MLPLLLICSHTVSKFGIFIHFFFLFFSLQTIFLHLWPHFVRSIWEERRRKTLWKIIYLLDIQMEIKNMEGIWAIKNYARVGTIFFGKKNIFKKCHSVVMQWIGKLHYVIYERSLTYLLMHRFYPNCTSLLFNEIRFYLPRLYHFKGLGYLLCHFH